MSRLPILVSGCDIKSLPLTPADGFLLSRVDAMMSEQDLALITGFPPEQVAEMLDRLAALGAIAFRDPSASQTRLRAPQKDGPVRRVETPEPTAEDVLLLRRQALARKLSGTHSATTGATPAVRPQRATEPDPGHVRRASEAALAHGERAANAANVARAAECMDRGKSALARNDFAGAVNAYRLAASLAPDDEDLQASCNDAIRRARGALADTQWQQAILDEREERWEEAALGYAKVCAGRPGHALAHERAANAALRSANVRRAVEFARKAIELEPSSALFRVTLARAYLAAGFEKSAQSELGRALEMAPDDARLRSLVARVEARGRKTG